MERVARTAGALAAGLAGGALFAWLHIPLPWMLGSLTAAAVAAIAGIDFTLPLFFRNFARPVIGVFAGSAFTLQVLARIAESWEIFFILLAFIVAITALGFLFFHRVCRFDRPTAYFASTPGGLAELTLIGGMYGGEMRTLVVVHLIRVVAVAVLVPFSVQFLVDSSPPIGSAPIRELFTNIPLQDWLLLAACTIVGYWIGCMLKTPSAPMIVPLVLSAAVHVSGLSNLAPPGWLVAFMQVVIGTICGARFAGVSLREFRMTIFYSVVWAVFMLLAAFLTALLASLVVDAPLPALLLAFSPGGFAEITIVAYAIGIDVAFVVCCQVFRIFIVMSFGVFGFRLVAGPPGKAD